MDEQAEPEEESSAAFTDTVRLHYKAFLTCIIDVLQFIYHILLWTYLF